MLRVLLVYCAVCVGAAAVDFDWRLASHFEVPDDRALAQDLGLKAAGCQAVAFAGPDYNGKPTRVFAWVGMPPEASTDNRVPGIVLVHGGGGTAFAEWVGLWTARGYAAIAIDTCGSIPVRQAGNKKAWQRLADGGPAGWGGFKQSMSDLYNTWNYHAVANVIRSHSWLRAQAQVDPDNIAITGISWGGYLTCMVAGLDHRFRCAVPVYGCGFMGQSPMLQGRVKALDKDWLVWHQHFDPSRLLPQAQMPICFVNGTNDAWFIPPMWSPSTELPRGSVVRSLQRKLRHSHKAGWAPKEIAAFIDSHTKGRPALIGLGAISMDEGRLTAPLTTAVGADGTVSKGVHPSCLYTTSDGEWSKRKWRPAKATIDGMTIQAAVPVQATAAFLVLTDPKGLTTSSTVYIPEE